MRRLFIIAAVVVALAGIGVVLYFTLSGPSSSVTVAPQPTEGGLPVAGSAPAPSAPTTEGETSSTGAPPESVSVTSRLVRVSQGPVAYGEATVDQAAANASSTPTTVVNFIDRQSGNVFSYAVQTRTITRTSNRTVPGIQSAFWHPSGQTAYVRYLSGSDFSTINTYALPASGGNGFFLPQNLSDISVASTSILTLASGVNGSTASVSRTDGTHTAAVFSTPLTSIRASFLGKSQYLVTTKASASLAGDAFTVDAGGRFTRIAGPLNGLAALASPSGKWIFVTYISNSGLASELVNPTTGETVPVPIGTIADKCVWAQDDSAVYCGVPTSTSDGTYPDDWYQGAAHTRDRIWKVNITGRYAQLVADVSGEGNTDIDVVAPAINKAGTVLVFANKNDGSLWVFSL